ncbi:MAG TPA: D-ornithine 4,5-aminomutase subunit OraS, partial [Candidatus Rifleibacterium sp.]|nr:D-ornithine 4,5-aminomutase subunit OraS [Candidatus Rifleibacterium sp.]
MSEERIKKFEARRQQLRKMSDEQLKERFWELCNQMVEPMVEYGRKYTSMSIERSVLLR